MALQQTLLSTGTTPPELALWLGGDDSLPPTPPPKTPRSMAFGKRSMASIASSSTTGSAETRRGNHARGSTSLDADIPAVHVERARNGSVNEHDAAGADGEPRGALRKARSIVGKIVKRSKSRARLAEDEPPAEAAPPLPPLSFPPAVPSSSSSFGIPSFGRRDRKRSKDPAGAGGSAGSVDDELGGTKYEFDLDIGRMDGIVDVGRLAPPPPAPLPTPTRAPAVEIKMSGVGAAPSPPSFSDPWGLPTPPASSDSRSSTKKRRLAGPPPPREFGSGSAPAPAPAPVPAPAPAPALASGSGTNANGWSAPDSWVIPRGAPVLDMGSDDDDDGAPGAHAPLVKPSPTARRAGGGERRPGSGDSERRRARRKTKLNGGEKAQYKLRVYIGAGSTDFRVLSLGLSHAVGTVCQFLAKELLNQPDGDGGYWLFLRERGRERILGDGERPADIVRRRLEQAGYTPADGLPELGGEGLSFLLKFVYRRNLLGPPDDELRALADYAHVDLTARGLRTIPIALHARADAIVSLDLSRNPMLELPRDFVQSCAGLRALVLSNMALKRVPGSVVEAAPLRSLDVSCNRIAELGDVALDRLAALARLDAQNNRMESLPWYFPRLGALRTLNISNNKFRVLPAVVCELAGLTHLDVSFNMLEGLPGEICALVQLEELIMVGNRVTAFPPSIKCLTALRVLDCRRNAIVDIGPVSMLPALERLSVNHNALHSVSLTSGRFMREIDLGHNDITHVSLLQGPIGSPPTSLARLDLSHAKLSSLDGLDFTWMPGLRVVRVDGNGVRHLPPSICELAFLEELSAADNNIEELPVGIGNLARLEVLDVRSNCLQEVPAEIWRCGRLRRVNMTSNVITVWHPPAPTGEVEGEARKASLAPSDEPGELATAVEPPPLVRALTALFLGENQLADDALAPLMLLRGLRVLNLSFNEIQALPAHLFTALHRLTHLYVSGNRLASLPTEGLGTSASRAPGVQLRVLFLNGNRLQTLPQELGKVVTLESLDVGSNELRYNINNWEFDWNWNFNQNLRYLNLSGNKRLEIKPDASRKNATSVHSELAGFGGLPRLRVLGLMDVTASFNNQIPDDSEERRVRTSLSAFNNLSYGIADNLGAAAPDTGAAALAEAASSRSLASRYRAEARGGTLDTLAHYDSMRFDPAQRAPLVDGDNEISVRMFDLVVPRFRDRDDEALFAMFGRARAPPANARIARYLADNLARELATELDRAPANEGGVADALRRAFLRLNWLAHDSLFAPAAPGRKMSSQSAGGGGALNGAPVSARDAQALGASGVVTYLAGRTLYVANAGAALAVVSRRGHAELVSTRHDPFARREIERIRLAEGWVSPKGLVNDDAPVARGFGYYHLVPVVNARPDVAAYALSDLDEFVIIANEGLWDFISPQTAVDIARTERADPGLAAQKLRDLAISYGAEGTTMIMVIAVSSGAQPQPYHPRRGREYDPRMNRLNPEQPAPSGHLALVFTDIRNSTLLWDTVDAGMQTAIRLHHTLLRRVLRESNGFEVKTEGDAFMVAFSHVGDALLWCMAVQTRLLDEDWPREILESEEGRARHGPAGELLARGLSVRMGIHCGSPVCERDVTTQRMDYYGPMVNRAARVMGSAAGGQIMLTADVVRELREGAWESNEDIAAFAPRFRPVGEVKLKGLEMPEVLTLVYPEALAARHELVLEELAAPPRLPPPPSVAKREQDASASDSASKDAEPAAAAANTDADADGCTPEQVRALATIVLRLQALAGGRVLRAEPGGPNALTMDPAVLVNALPERVGDADRASALEMLLLSLEGAVRALRARIALPDVDALLDALLGGRGQGVGELLAALGGDVPGRPP